MAEEKSAASDLVPQTIIEQKIFFIRGHKVMLSNDLAKLYQVEAKRLIQAVRRNKQGYPDDFMRNSGDTIRIPENSVASPNFNHVTQISSPLSTEDTFELIS